MEDVAEGLREGTLPLQGQTVQLLRVSGECRAANQPSRNALWRTGKRGPPSEGSAAIFRIIVVLQTVEFRSDLFSTVWNVRFCCEGRVERRKERL